MDISLDELVAEFQRRFQVEFELCVYAVRVRKFEEKEAADGSSE